MAINQISKYTLKLWNLSVIFLQTLKNTCGMYILYFSACDYLPYL